MWFDLAAALAEIEGADLPKSNATLPATSATPATPSRRVASVADVAAPALPMRPDPPSARGGWDMGRHGVSITGFPLTWTGRPVTQAHWRHLTQWQRSGPDGRHWCGIRRAWVER